MTKEDVVRFRELQKLSKFKFSKDYEQLVEDEILTRMYSFLGFRASKELLRLPNLTQSELESICLLTDDEEFFDVYQKTLYVDGNLKITNEFFKKILPLFPDKKTKIAVFKNLNDLLENDFNGSFEELLRLSFEKGNFDIDPLTIGKISNQISKTFVNQKMEFIENNMSYGFESESPKNKKLLTNLLDKYIKQSLTRFEKLDSEYINGKLEEEIERKKENGEPFYSLYIIRTLKETIEVGIINFLKTNERLDLSIVRIT